MGPVPESVSRLIVPVLNLGVSRVWQVGGVRFHPAGSAADLIEAAIGGSDSVPPVLPGVMTDRLAELDRGVVAEVAASSLPEAMSLVENALAVLRVVQRFQRPMADGRRQAFGLPGQVMSAGVAYFMLGEELRMGGARIGALGGWTFSDDDYEAWVTDPVYRYVDAALACEEADRTALQRRTLVTIDLLSQAWLSGQPDVALLNSVMALEVLLAEENDVAKKFRLARRVSYFLCGWPGDDRYTTRKRQACPLLALPLDGKGYPEKDLKKLINDVNAGRAELPCTQFFDVLDLYDARNRIVHGGRLGLTDDEQTRATWFVANWLLRQVLAWFTDHPDAELTDLDAEIASLSASTV
jgi:Apea-like HEPN